MKAVNAKWHQLKVKKLDKSVEGRVEGPEIVVLVMGDTGCGKSSLINLLTGKDSVAVGETLESKTKSVEAVEWIYRGRIFKLIDTPAFDDTYLTEMEVLIEISTFLEQIYKRKSNVSGILYLHPIGLPRMRDNAVRNLKVFRELWGREGLATVTLITTLWDVTPRKSAQAREQQLIRRFWQPLIEQGSKVLRHDGSKATAAAMIDVVMHNDVTVLDIQKQLVDEGRKLSQTEAGKMMLEAGLIHQRRLEIYLGEMEHLLASGDDEKREISKETARIKSRLDRVKNELSSLDDIFLSSVSRLGQEIRLLSKRSQIPETAAFWAIYERTDHHRLQDLGKPLPAEPLLSEPAAAAGQSDSIVE